MRKRVELYRVTALPSNILIDPTGKIVAQNLTGKEVAEKIKSFIY